MFSNRPLCPALPAILGRTFCILALSTRVAAAALPSAGEDLLAGRGLSDFEVRGEASALGFSRTETGSWVATSRRDLAQPWEVELSMRVGDSMPPGSVGLLRF